ARQSSVPLEWRDVHGTRSLIADTIMEHGLSSDLVIMPQATGEEWGPWSELPDRVILNVGRPVLVVPAGLNMHEPPRRILVAWNDSPKSARAMFDALPILAQAHAVDVVAVARSTTDETASALAVDQVAIALARHGVKVEASTSLDKVATVGQALLDLTLTRHADALVMGCYGHSRFREALLGGVSRMILSKLHLPVLMSH
ncbi:MAG: universal stress protein, partial [Hyphomicrobiaceae bacterium]